MTWLIARRAAIEALHDRLTLLMSVFFAVVLPLGFVSLIAVQSERRAVPDTESGVGAALALYLLLVGLTPAISAVGIAAGQFAGEKERGILTPLLASPASNLAIFGGKVLGAIIPALVYACVGEAVYILGVAVVLGPSRLLLVPLWLSVAMVVVLVPSVTCFAAILASLISSRVRTFNAAQQISGLVLMPVWGIVVGLAVKLQEWGPAALLAAVAGLLLLDVCLTVAAAATWRREEVLART
jgi:ABC-type Na+ efflux pump permease subunit